MLDRCQNLTKECPGLKGVEGTEEMCETVIASESRHQTFLLSLDSRETLTSTCVGYADYMAYQEWLASSESHV